MNYFEYFSEVEARFTARRGSLLLLSTLDWALIETWRAAGVPLVAVLRGIDAAFDRYEARKALAKGRLGKVNGLAWCAQAVMQAATEMADAALGTATTAQMSGGQTSGTQTSGDSGFETKRVARFLLGNADRIEAARPALAQTADRLRALAAEVLAGTHPALEHLDRTLTVLEERLFAAVIADTPEAELLALRETADRELHPFRARMGAVQARQVRDQFVQKRLFAAYALPRLSLFYMPLEDAGGEEASA